MRAQAAFNHKMHASKSRFLVVPLKGLTDIIGDGKYGLFSLNYEPFYVLLAPSHTPQLVTSQFEFMMLSPHIVTLDQYDESKVDRSQLEEPLKPISRLRTVFDEPPKDITDLYWSISLSEGKIRELYLDQLKTFLADHKFKVNVNEYINVLVQLKSELSPDAYSLIQEALFNAKGPVFSKEEFGRLTALLEEKTLPDDVPILRLILEMLTLINENKAPEHLLQVFRDLSEAMLIDYYSSTASEELLLLFDTLSRAFKIKRVDITNRLTGKDILDMQKLLSAECSRLFDFWMRGEEEYLDKCLTSRWARALFGDFECFRNDVKTLREEGKVSEKIFERILDNMERFVKCAEKNEDASAYLKAFLRDMSTVQKIHPESFRADSRKRTILSV